MWEKRVCIYCIPKVLKNHSWVSYKLTFYIFNFVLLIRDLFVITKLTILYSFFFLSIESDENWSLVLYMTILLKKNIWCIWPISISYNWQKIRKKGYYVQTILESIIQNWKHMRSIWNRPPNGVFTFYKLQFDLWNND